MAFTFRLSIARFALCLLFCGLLACKKKDLTYTFDGNVTSSVDGDGLADVEVELSQVLYNSGVANTNFQPAASTETDTWGEYSIVIDREKAINFKLDFSKSGFFSVSKELSSDDVSTSEPYTLDQVLEPESWVTFHVWNQFPVPGDQATLFKVDFREDCIGCTTNGYSYFYEDVNTTFSLKTTGGTYANFSFKNEVTGMIYPDSVYCTPFDTVYYDFFY